MEDGDILQPPSHILNRRPRRSARSESFQMTSSNQNHCPRHSRNKKNIIPPSKPKRHVRFACQNNREDAEVVEYVTNAF